MAGVEEMRCEIAEIEKRNINEILRLCVHTFRFASVILLPMPPKIR